MTTGGPISKRAEREARCAGWRKLSYSAKDDTPESVKGIRIHNKTGANKRCWTAQPKNTVRPWKLAMGEPIEVE